MKIPTYVQDKLVELEGKDAGYITKQWSNLVSQLLQVMQQSLSDEGFQIPNQPTTNIVQLTNMSNGTIIYDSTTDQFKGMVGGTLKTFTLT